jgi:hypothetical protein
MNTNQKKVGIGFWLVWVLASTLGYGLGAVLGIAVLLAARIPDGIVFPILFGAIFGAIGALAQWIVIRGQVPESGLWVPFSAVVFMLSIVSAASGSSNASPDFNPFFIVAGIYGLLGGFLQSLILEKRGVPIGWWIAASVLGGLLGCTMNGSAVAAVSTDSAWQMGTTTFFLTWFRLGAPFGFGLGLITGGVLLWFSRHPRISSKDEAAMQGTG